MIDSAGIVMVAIKLYHESNSFFVFSVSLNVEYPIEYMFMRIRRENKFNNHGKQG